MTNASSLPAPESVAKRVLRKVGPSRPPVDLDKIIEVWEQLRIVEEDLDGCGYLLPIGKLGAEIIVNRSSTLEVKRFTIAHELGHWVLGLIWENKFKEFRQPNAIASYEEIERWCDAFATSLLMPRELVECALRGRDTPIFIDAVLRGCREFNVSRQAFFLRVWELTQVHIVILRSASDSRGKYFALERSYGDKLRVRILEEFFQHHKIQAKLQIESPLLFFSGKAASYSFKCSGRRTSRTQITMAVTWSDGQNSG